MTEFLFIADARQDMKGSIVATVTNIGDLKSGTNSKGDWTMKIITLADGSGKEDMAVFNEEIKLFKLNCKYEIENPWWKVNAKNELAFALGQYAKVKMVSDDTAQEPIIEDDAQVPTSEEYLKQRQTEIDAKLKSLPKLDVNDENLADSISLKMYQIKQCIDKNISKYEEKPNQGMIWEMTKEVYRQHLETLIKNE